MLKYHAMKTYGGVEA